ncbi:sorbitol utilization protein SOU2 [Nemania sp. NC0429]|nr:sorbitol utilization protein SOU2 [Nemania sp. NC0429]
MSNIKTGNYPLDSMPVPQSDLVMPLLSLKGRTAIVTGAGAGIGLAVAHGLAEAGANVAIWYNSNTKAVEEAAAIEAKFGVKCKAYQVDVRSYDSVKGAVDSIVGEFNGRLDVFVSNSAIMLDGSRFIDGSLDDASKLLQVNVHGTLNCAKAAALHWRRQSQERTTVDGRPLENYLTGSFISTTSIAGSAVPVPMFQSVYSASKAALIHACKCFAVEWAGFARANSVSPGYFKTNMTGAIPEETLNVWCGKTPMRRGGQLVELKGAYLYLASDAASYTTGMDLIVDGGYGV